MLQYLFANPLFFIGWLIALVIGITIHEFAHAYTAYRLGDSTAKMAGRVTFNPIAHMDPLGTLMLFLAGFGWGKPVPVNPFQLRHGRWGQVLVSLSGPLSNVIAAAIFALPLRILITANVETPAIVIQVLQAIIELNLILAIFNLIPIPPLDGSRILTALAPRAFSGVMAEIERIGPFVLLGIIVLTIVMNIPLFSRIILPLVSKIEYFFVFWPS
ncbi:site-2 protease family protein [Patescibacteria group bacterium]|nr:MAG: site-2 protease family protein [Patescibacteria group bacterium]